MHVTIPGPWGIPSGDTSSQPGATWKEPGWWSGLVDPTLANPTIHGETPEDDPEC
jgi:hypothetical protein